MAVGSGALVIVGIEILTFIVIYTSATNFPSTQTVEKWTFELQDRLKKIVIQNTAWEELQKNYKQEETVVRIEQVDMDQLLKQAAQNIGDLFVQRKVALENIVKAAEASGLEHKFDSGLELNDVKALNAKHLSEAEVDLQFHPQFRQPVNSSFSSVHIPLEVYEGYPEIVNALQWSKQLDQTFRQNYKQDDQLKWQYFASREGFLRIFPAFRWRSAPHAVDLYDARRRSWYTQTVASPKDMLIIIDTSGSIHGPSLEILKISVKMLLTTLNEQDFVNVAQFSSSVSWLDPCLSGLVPANTRNKRILYEALDRIEPFGIASYTNALTFAYSQFKQQRSRSHSQPGLTANCLQSIVLLSDGGTEVPQDALDSFSKDPLTKDIRVFTLALGPHPIPTVSLKTMACNTKGFFGAVVTMGAIRGKTQEYLDVLSRPLALSKNDKMSFTTNAYEDTGGLGTVLSLSQPVFNRTKGNASQVLLGIAGVDVTLNELEQFLPTGYLGASAYAFGVTDTGHIIFHPGLHHHANYLEDPLAIELEDLELQGEVTTRLRREMLDRNEGRIYFDAFVTFDARYATYQSKYYLHRPVPATSYSLALAVPAVNKVVKVEDESVENVKQQWNESQLKHRVAHHFPSVCKHTSHTDLDNMETFLNMLENKDNCDLVMMNRVLWDMRLTHDALKQWENHTAGINSRFVLTESGLARVELPSAPSFVEALKDSHTSSVYRRLSSSKMNYLLTFWGNASYLLASKIKLKDQTVAVTGAQVSATLIHSLWVDTTHRATAEELHCGDTEDLHCYLLDEGGFILATNQRQASIGAFMGSSRGDPELMRSLLFGKNPVFNLTELRRPTASCPLRRDGETAAANSLRFLLDPLARVISTPFHTESLWNLASGMATAFYSFLFASLPQLAKASPSSLLEVGLDQLRPNKVTSRLCATRTSYYGLLTPSNSATSTPEPERLVPPPGPDGFFSISQNLRQIWDQGWNCSVLFDSDINCTRRFKALSLPETHVVLIVATPSCNCANVVPLTYGTHEDEEDFCQAPLRYRTKPQFCYAKDQREDARKCTGSGGRNSFFMALVFLPAIALLLTH